MFLRQWFGFHFQHSWALLFGKFAKCLESVADCFFKIVVRCGSTTNNACTYQKLRTGNWKWHESWERVTLHMYFFTMKKKTWTQSSFLCQESDVWNWSLGNIVCLLIKCWHENRHDAKSPRCSKGSGKLQITNRNLSLRTKTDKNRKRR